MPKVPSELRDLAAGITHSHKGTGILQDWNYSNDEVYGISHLGQNAKKQNTVFHFSVPFNYKI